MPNKPSKEDPVVNITEAFIGVALTSIMLLVVIFFATLLLIEPPEHAFGLRMPLVFLFFSAFGLIYATLIYANASGEIARVHKNRFDKQQAQGNVLSEIVGIYGLVIAIPIAVLEHSSDTDLSLLVFAMGGLSLLLYHALGYSILQRYAGRAMFVVLTAVILALYGAVFLSAYYENLHFHEVASYASILFLSTLTFVALRSTKELSNT